MTASIYLLRHGETEWNAQGRIQGALDSPLTGKGIRQTRAMGAILARNLARPAPPLWCSPLGRARQTLELVCAEAGIDPAQCRFDDRLRELSWGAWDGMTRTEIEALVPGAMEARLADHWQHRPPGGGSYAELADRLRPLLAEIRATGGIVVGHGASGRRLRGLGLGPGPAEIGGLAEPQDTVFRLTPGGGMDVLTA